MTVSELVKKLNLKVVTLPGPERVIGGVYIGDLLSFVMGKAREGDVWITIMSNINVMAVATLANTSCVILAEGVTLEEKIVDTAKEKCINILSSDKTAYELAVEISRAV